ncbi:DoxX family protein [Bermanella sp. R86510]|uniref:DoxX family protein n=1 Tax=unclassified Bermanella TaxID=2627862 RepID=UPI0037C59721
MEKYSMAIGRSLLGLYFLLPGIMKFVSWDMHVALMEKHGMVFIPVLLILAGITQIAASISILANRFVAPAAFVLAALVVVINVCLHDFWNYTGVEGAHEMQNFVKNLGILGGLLVLASHDLISSKHS